MDLSKRYYHEIFTLLDAVIVNGSSAKWRLPKGARIAEVIITGTGTVSATVELFGAISENSEGLLLTTFSLSGTTSDSATAPNPGEEIPEFPIHYFTVSALTGTDAAVTATLAV